MPVALLTRMRGTDVAIACRTGCESRSIEDERRLPKGRIVTKLEGLKIVLLGTYMQHEAMDRTQGLSEW